MTGYAIIYGFFFLLCIGFILLEKKLKNSNERHVILLVLVFLFSIIIALRPSNVKDTSNYIELFHGAGNILEQISGINIMKKYAGYEIGMIVLSYLASMVLVSYKSWFFLIAFVSTIMICYNLKKIENYLVKPETPYYGVILAYFVSYFGLSYFAVALRMGMAFALSSWGIRCYVEKKYVRALVLLCAGFLFQRTIVVVGLFALLFYLKGKRETIMAAYLVTAICMFINIGAIFWESISGYLVKIMNTLGINGLQNYILIGTDQAIGKLDWYYWLVGLVIVFLFVYCKEDRLMPLAIGLIVMALCVAFLHGIRAIIRIYDVFILFSIPIVSNAYYKKNDVLKTAIITMLSVNVLVMYTIVL